MFEMKEMPKNTPENTVWASNVILTSPSATEAVNGIGVLVGDQQIICRLDQLQALAIASDIVSRFTRSLDAAVAEKLQSSGDPETPAEVVQ